MLMLSDSVLIYFSSDPVNISHLENAYVLVWLWSEHLASDSNDTLAEIVLFL